MDNHEIAKLAGGMAAKKAQSDAVVEKLLRLVEMQAMELSKQRRKIRAYRKWIEVQCPN